ncbi:hypothetical protein CLV51_1011135 [Chitinophaga niastensis]|uniref:Uncharacterized protein n=1 Tax=Chitinophaga niastensis TaxID=536980 RepID=A0A2P8HU90_CHINA|nr:hypothetical protein [Chitinophaga niastensis]PSL49799.1 hypothetical protein CLV51_1011135 [Chitinophaga niastensis]
MKIRLRGNSIRYRLDKTDITLLETTGKVESITHIGAGTLHFCIRGKEITDPVIKMEHDGVHLLLPVTLLTPWYAPDQVGFELILPNTDGSELTILVEKDFKCLTEREEDDSQSFDNPMTDKNC